MFAAQNLTGNSAQETGYFTFSISVSGFTLLTIIIFCFQELGKNYFKCLQDIAKVQGLVLDQELVSWKRTQRLCGQEEMPNKKELDQLQQWCEQLAELLWRNRIQIRQVDVHTRTHTHIHTHTHTHCLHILQKYKLSYSTVVTV